MADAYEVREFRDSDLGEVLDVMRASLGESDVNQRTEALFRWKHFDNPFGRSIILVADAGGRIAGLRAFMRWELRDPKGAVVRAVRPVDTATHPDFQRMGIFRNLTMAALDVARSDGTNLVFNTPNAQSGAGYRKMGWSDVQPIGALVRPKRPWRRSPADRSLLIPGGRAPTASDALDRPATGLRTPRTADYRRWRFVQHPTAGYRMVELGSASVYLRPNVRSGRGEVVVSDIAGTVDAAQFREAARAADAHYLVTWFSHGSTERRAAITSGFLPVPRLVALTQVALPLTDLDMDVHDPTSWDLSTGDLELL